MTHKIAEYFKTQPILKAWLFGSYSRGEQREYSDIDILILVNVPPSEERKKLDMCKEIQERTPQMEQNIQKTERGREKRARPDKEMR